MNVRKELEALRDYYHSQANCILVSDAEGCDEIADHLNALLQRIPDGWEMRPREPSEGMLETATQVSGLREKWRAMWDECGGDHE